jgi:hypothetical protein
MCSTKAACTGYTVSGLTDTPAKIAACSAIKTSDTNGCTYWPGVAATCSAKAACNTYTGTTSATVAADCAAQKDATGLVCIAATGGTACAAPATCGDIATPGS